MSETLDSTVETLSKKGIKRGDVWKMVIKSLDEALRSPLDKAEDYWAVNKIYLTLYHDYKNYSLNEDYNGKS